MTGLDIMDKINLIIPKAFLYMTKEHNLMHNIHILPVILLTVEYQHTNIPAISVLSSSSSWL